MAFGYVIAILIISAVLTFGVNFISEKVFVICRKAFALALSVTALARCVVYHEDIFDVRGLNMYSPFGDNIPQTVLSVILVWFTYSALLNIVLSQFFESRALKHLTRYFSAPVIIADLIFFTTYVTAIVGTQAFITFDFRLPLIVIEMILGLTLVFSGIHKDKTLIPTKGELLSLILTIPLTVFAIMPSYVPQALLGWDKTGMKLTGFSEAHRLAIYIGLLVPFLVFHLLKDKNHVTKRLALIYISTSMLWSYLSAHPIADWIEPWRWPLHLCSLAMFIIVFSLLFNSKLLCYFGLYSCVIGAFIMMLLTRLNPSVNAMATDQVVFWMNHYAVFALPILSVALKIFPRPNFKNWLGSLSLFTVYFVLIIILNALFINYYPDADFFFLNGNFIVDKLGTWAYEIKNITIGFNIGDITLTFYPIYQILFYVCYVALSALSWLVFKLLFASWDKSEARRLRERDYKQMKKDLKKHLGSIQDNTAEKNCTPSIVLNNFSKIYGANKHYSVDHVSFSVKGGEIFGFLGPNGAGKSTIIKSIVGIQTLTSGSIEICGYDVECQSVQAKLNTGFVPDHYALYENLTGREYINYIADLYNVDEETRNETIEKYVTRFQLTNSFDNQMKTYSHGMKQKIAIMAALVHNPKVWILDEPLTGLDPNSIFEVKECMKEHAAKGNIVFFSSHIIDVVEKICDKIAIIKKGKLRAAATVSELEERGIDLEAFYLETINADNDAPLVSIGGDDILCITSEEASQPKGDPAI